MRRYSGQGEVLLLRVPDERSNIVVIAILLIMFCAHRVAGTAGEAAEVKRFTRLGTWFLYKTLDR